MWRTQTEELEKARVLELKPQSSGVLLNVKGWMGSRARVEKLTFDRYGCAPSILRGRRTENVVVDADGFRVWW